MVTSRVGRKPVAVPAGVDIKVQGQSLHIKGPKGQSTFAVHPSVLVQLEGGFIKVELSSTKSYCRSGSGLKLNKSITGTARSKIANLVQGVSKGFERKLALVGVGYRAQVKGKELHLSIGYSHPVIITAPEGITIETPNQTEIIVKGVDNHLVGHIASKIRAAREPEPYKGKGIRYVNEIIILKETKKK